MFLETLFTTMERRREYLAQVRASAYRGVFVGETERSR